MKTNISCSSARFIVLIHSFSSIPTVTMFWLRISFSERWLQPTASFQDVCWPKLAERLAGWSATFRSTWPAQHTSSRIQFWTLRKGPWPHSHGTSATLASWYHTVCFHRHPALHKVRTWLHNAFFCLSSRPQSVEERCEYRINPENGSWTEIKREAWISSNVYGLTRAIQVSRVKWRATVLNNSESGVWRLKGRLTHLSDIL